MSNFAGTQKYLNNGTDVRMDYLLKNNMPSNSNKIGKVVNSKAIRNDAEQRPKFYLGSYVHTAK